MFTENLPGFIFIIGCIVALVVIAGVAESRKARRDIRAAVEEMEVHFKEPIQIDPARARSMANHPAGKGLVR